MKLKCNCKLALALTAILACNALIEFSQAFSFFDSIKRPFSAVATKARNLRDRAFSSKRQERNDRIQGRSAGPVPVGGQGPRVSNSRPAGSPSDNSSTDFESRCFLSRGPNFKKPPKLYFYSKRTHGPDTLSCATDKTIQFELNPVDGDMSDSPELDRSLIQSEIMRAQLFDPKAPTYFLVHGFLASWNGDNWMCNIKDLVLNSTEANVFIVDWSGGAKPMLPIDYSASVSNTQYVGALLGEFINSLVFMSGQKDASRYHMIGHSLGAHICGFAGYYVNTLGRITGLDPAGPCFSSDSDAAQLEASSNGFLSGGRRRLSPESADFVVALHTDMGLFGLKENCADYDVFVNGGFKQPKCASSSFANRLEDLMQLNLKDAVALDLTCAHSFAHEIVNTFINFFRGASQSASAIFVNQNRTPPGKQKVPDSERCFPMAFECANWDAYKAGECGFCTDNDPRCVFTGLSLDQYQAKKTADVQYKGSRLSEKEDDHDYNDEDADLGNDDPDATKMPEKNSLERFAQNQHFMRSGSLPEACLFQYQVVVATRSKDIDAIENEGKYYFYLHLPLELSGRLLDSKGDRLHDRLVQVSHKVEVDSTAYQLLQSNYMNTLAARGALTPMDEQKEVDFYTALITFRHVPAEECEHDLTNGASRKDYWQLCKPLDSINEARLWSSSEQKLNSVIWVGLNYMSGLNEELRFKNSYVMKRAEGQQVRARDKLEEVNRPNLDDLEPEQSNSIGNVVDKARNKAGCLLSLFDARSSSEPKYNFRCGRSANELKFAVNLAPKRLA